MEVAYTIEQCWHRVPGGTAVSAIETARALGDLPGLELIGVAGLHRRSPRPPFQPPIPVRQIPLPRPLMYEAWHYLRRPPVQVAAGSVDVIHATTLAVPPKSAPLVTTIHDLAFLTYPEHFTRRGLRFFRRGLRLTLEDADLVLCPSEATREHCVQVGFDRDRLVVVPLGVSLGPAAPGEVERVRVHYNLPNRYIFFAGTIEPRKNLQGLLEAFRLLKSDADLVLAGPEGWNENLDALIAGGIRSRVKVLGFVPPADLAPLYAGAAVACSPSWLEGFGLPVLEAMSQGAPVVTSRGTSTEEVAGDAAVLVDPHRPESIADGLASILEDDGLARELSEKGRLRAASFTWSRTAELTARAYAKVGQ